MYTNKTENIKRSLVCNYVCLNSAFLSFSEELTEMPPLSEREREK